MEPDGQHWPWCQLLHASVILWSTKRRGHRTTSQTLWLPAIVPLMKPTAELLLLAYCLMEYDSCWRISGNHNLVKQMPSQRQSLLCPCPDSNPNTCSCQSNPLRYPWCQDTSSWLARFLCWVGEGVLPMLYPLRLKTILHVVQDVPLILFVEQCNCKNVAICCNMTGASTGNANFVWVVRSTIPIRMCITPTWHDLTATHQRWKTRW